MIAIRNTNDRFGMPETFTGEILFDAIDAMQVAIRACGPEFADVVVGPDDYEVVRIDHAPSDD
jgi:hypothetical protein